MTMAMVVRVSDGSISIQSNDWEYPGVTRVSCVLDYSPGSLVGLNCRRCFDHSVYFGARHQLDTDDLSDEERVVARERFIDWLENVEFRRPGCVRHSPNYVARMREGDGTTCELDPFVVGSVVMLLVGLALGIVSLGWIPRHIIARISAKTSVIAK
ncbi:MAG TPA: hypothetical protein VG797_08035 [Phycisphaerales bacterium]|nr:hypothetical protein [Phycisphaerales bacterium]